MRITFSNQLVTDSIYYNDLAPDDAAYKLAVDWMDQGCSLGEAVAAAAATVCGVRWASVNKVRPNSTKVQILALFDNGEFTDCYSYHFHGTPCEEVLANEKFCRFDDVQSAFPDDEELRQMGVVDYAGKSVRSVDTRLLGHLVVFNDSMINDIHRLESVVCRLVPLLQLEWDNFYD